MAFCMGFAADGLFVLRLVRHRGQLGYGEAYKYAHDYEDHFVVQQFLPDGLEHKRRWFAQENAQENKMKEQMIKWWGDRFK